MRRLGDTDWADHADCLDPHAAESDFPAVSGPARIYLFASELSYPVREWTRGSRYVLYDDSTFALQYRSPSSFQYFGTYTDANGLITFEWEGRSVAGPWGATGSLVDDSLTVRYNLIMEMTDFENAFISGRNDAKDNAGSAQRIVLAVALTRHVSDLPTVPDGQRSPNVQGFRAAGALSLDSSRRAQPVILAIIMRTAAHDAHRLTRTR